MPETFSRQAYAFVGLLTSKSSGVAMLFVGVRNNSKQAFNFGTENISADSMVGIERRRKMKLLGMVAIGLGICSGAQARIGETEVQIEARYGLPVPGNPEVGPQRDELGNEIRVYKFHHFNIAVTFAGGISQVEMFAKYKEQMLESWDTLTQTDIDAILAAYESSGIKWQPGEALGTAKRPTWWTSTDGRLKADRKSVV